MKVMTILLHAAFEDRASQEATAVARHLIEVCQKELGARAVHVWKRERVHARPDAQADDAAWAIAAQVELQVEQFVYGGENSRNRADSDLHREVLTDLAYDDPDRSQRRWKRIRELEVAWHQGWEPEVGGKRPKGQISFGDTPEAKVIAGELAHLRNLERHTAIVLDWPVWQGGQHFRVLLDGELMEGSVESMDLQRGTVDCYVWPEHDLVASLRKKEPHELRTVTIEQIRAGEDEYARQDELRRQARAAESTPEKPKKPKTPKPDKPAGADLFTAIPAAE